MSNYRVEISCDGGNTWSSFGEPVSEEEAIREKSEIDHNTHGWDISVRVVPALTVYEQCCALGLDSDLDNSFDTEWDLNPAIN